MFGFGASIWMNLVVAYELNRFSESFGQKRSSYQPLTTRDIFKVTILIYMIQMAVTCTVFIPEIPLDYNAVWNLGSLYDIKNSSHTHLGTFKIMFSLDYHSHFSFFVHVSVIMFVHYDM